MRARQIKSRRRNGKIDTEQPLITVGVSGQCHTNTKVANTRYHANANTIFIVFVVFALNANKNSSSLINAGVGGHWDVNTNVGNTTYPWKYHKYIPNHHMG